MVTFVKVKLSSREKIPKEKKNAEILKWVRGYLFGIMKHVPGINPENAIPISSDFIRGEIWFFIKMPLSLCTSSEMEGYIQGLLEPVLPEHVEIKKISIEK